MSRWVVLLVMILAASPGHALEATEGRSTSSPGTSPTWSPDGRLIAYQGSDYNIWVMLSDGSGRRLLTDDVYRDEQPAFSPDGMMLVYVSERRGYQELWVMEKDGSAKRQITSNGGWKHSPTWSPDGRVIAYIVSPERNGKGDVWLIDTATGQERSLTSKGGIRTVAWNPNDGRLAYLTVSDNNYDIRVIDTNTGSDELLLEDTYWKGHLAWSPDGKTIAFVSYREGNYDIWLLEDGNAQRVTSMKSWQVSPTWSPDGTKLAYASDESGTYEIWVSGLDATPVPVVDKSPAVAPAEAPTPQTRPAAESNAERSSERSTFEEKMPVLQLEEELAAMPSEEEIIGEIKEPSQDYLPVLLAAALSIMAVEYLSRLNLRLELTHKISPHFARFFKALLG